tara:strand:+ start:107 stop:748 length:642 start_codon:yes stop_codon:yes gene_type:complete
MSFIKDFILSDYLYKNSYFKVVDEVLSTPAAASFFYLCGLLGYVATTVFYYYLQDSYSGLKKEAPGNFSLPDLTRAVFWVHIAVGSAVMINAIGYKFFVSGNIQVFFQAFLVIGPGSFNTFVIGALLPVSATLSETNSESYFENKTNPLDLDPFETNLAALILACAQNALMLALLFLSFTSSAGMVRSRIAALPTNSGETNTDKKSARGSMYF